MLYRIGTKQYNIENDVIQNCQTGDNIENDVMRNCQTSIQHRKRCYTELAHQVCNIENDVIQNWHTKCITLKTMLYRIGTPSV